MKKVLLTLVLFVGFNFSALAQEPLIGEIKMFAGNFAPRGWAICDGSLLPISGNESLFSIVGTYYGGDGRTTFGLPDLRGRVAVGAGSGPGLTPRTIGSRFGAESANQTIRSGVNIPIHEVATMGEEVQPGKGSLLAVGNSETGYMHAGGDSELRMGLSQPSVTINYIICLTGIYPSRN